MSGEGKVKINKIMIITSIPATTLSDFTTSTLNNIIMRHIKFNKFKILLFVAFCFPKLIVAQTETRILSEITLPERGLSAHRGAMETHPENTIPAFRAAVKAGAQMIEFDVQLTKDSNLVVMHDGTVDRTTNGSGKISDLTLKEIRELDAGSWKFPEFTGLQVPTFCEVLDEMPVNVWLNIHLKGDGNAARMIAEILKEENRLHQAFLACGANAAKKARELVPEIKICNMDRQETNLDYISGTIEMDGDFIQLRGAIIPEFKDYSKILKENGVRINYCCTDSSDEIKMLFTYGVDFPLVNDIVNSIETAKVLGIDIVKPIFK